MQDYETVYRIMQFHDCFWHVYRIVYRKYLYSNCHYKPVNDCRI